MLIFVLIASASLPYLLSFDQYVMAAHSSSLNHKTKGDDTIQICCSWGKEIDDGILTYRIDDDANPQVIQSVHQAVNEWNSKVQNIQLQEVTDGNADIDIMTKSKAPKVSHVVSIGGPKISAGKNIKLVQPGESNISFDPRGRITHVDITIATTAVGNSIGLSELESIAKHEIGHAYGIGHTNFVDDLMSPVLTRRSNTGISQCDINGIEEANTSPHTLSPQFLRC